MKMKLAIPVFLIVTMVGTAWWTQSGPRMPASMAAEKKPSQKSGPIVIEATEARRGSLERTVEAVGNLTAGESVILSPEIAGRITEIRFEEGQPVKAGDVLVQLDDQISRAELAQAEASLGLSQANYARAKKLYAQGTVSGRSYDELRSQLNTDRAGVDLARARLDKTLIKAPFDGVVGLRSISVGDYVNPGQEMASLQSINPLKVDFRLPELYLNVLKTGQPIEIMVDAFPDRKFEGEVYAIDPLVDAKARTVVLRARLPNPENLLRPGLFARVSLLLGRSDGAILIPEQALVPQGASQYVYKVDGDKAVQTPVKTGTRQRGQVEIVEGLSEGDQVVTAGQMKIRPGVTIRIRDKTGAEQSSEPAP